MTSDATGHMLGQIATMLDILRDRYPDDPTDSLGHTPTDDLIAIANCSGLLAVFPATVDRHSLAALLGRDEHPDGGHDPLRDGRDLVAVAVLACRQQRQARLRTAVAAGQSHIVDAPSPRPNWASLAWVVPFMAAIDALKQTGAQVVARDDLAELAAEAAYAARMRLAFTDPDMVGQSEYRAIYDVCEGFFDDPAHIPSILEEFIAIAQQLLREIGDLPGTTEVACSTAVE